MQRTDIEWTTFTANPIKYRRKGDGKTVWACVKASPGCAHCYAEAIALRFDRGKLFSAANMAEVEPYLDEAELHKMLTAKTIGGVPVDGSRCFVGDMTDVFGAWVSDDVLDRLFATFALRSDVTFQVLTKRAERMAEYMLSRSKSSKFWEDAARTFGYALRWEHGGVSHPLCPWPLANVWLGVSAEDQKRADERIPHLLRTPATVRFLSCEPMLGPMDLLKNNGLDGHDYLRGWNPNGQGGCGTNTSRVDWVIPGCESRGSKAGRFADGYEAAARSIIQQCQAAGVAVLHKQMPINGRVSHDPAEWPEDLRVREYPTPAACRGA